jgi:hypothetical protein
MTGPCSHADAAVLTRWSLFGRSATQLGSTNVMRTYLVHDSGCGETGHHQCSLKEDMERDRPRLRDCPGFLDTQAGADPKYSPFGGEPLPLAK